VTGASSPWFANWSIAKQEKINDDTIQYQIKTQMATSTGLGQPAIMPLTVKKIQDHWFISSLDHDHLTSVSTTTPSQLKTTSQNATKLVTIQGLDDAIPFQMSPGAVIDYNEKGELEISKKGLLEEITNDQYQKVEVLAVVL
jgi:hypothetical protein